MYNQSFLSNLAGIAPDISKSVPKNLLARATGRFYTHELIGKHLADATVHGVCTQNAELLRIIDPFCGDGRLICWLLDSIAKRPSLVPKRWHIELWDCDTEALILAQKIVSSKVREHNIQAVVVAAGGDSFERASSQHGEFDVVITNPPWDVLKPDRRELQVLSLPEAEQYKQWIRAEAAKLERLYPLSMPERRFSGWGTNLARCGSELALRLTRSGCVCGLVSPSSLLADEMSVRLRKWLFEEFTFLDLAYYPSEAKLFDGVDQPSITLLVRATPQSSLSPTITSYSSERKASVEESPDFSWLELKRNAFLMPMPPDPALFRVLSSFQHLPTFHSMETSGLAGLWAGRELDETGHESFLDSRGSYRFVKGKMVRRFWVEDLPSQYVSVDGPPIPRSADHFRVAWRDVSRPSQKRRIHAAIIPPKHVTGNSLSVAYFKDDDLQRLKALLAVVNSLVFEAQVRGRLATGHVSLGAVRRAHVPDLTNSFVVESLCDVLPNDGQGGNDVNAEYEVLVAKLYGMTWETFERLLNSFPKLSEGEISRLRNPQLWRKPTPLGQRYEVTEDTEFHLIHDSKPLYSTA